MRYNVGVRLSKSTLERRLVTIPALIAVAVALTLTIPLWLPLTAVCDALRGRLRLPTVRLLAFGVCWAWLETAGVLAAFGLWISGQGRRQGLHYALQAWWAKNLLTALGATCGIRLEVDNIEAFTPGPAVLFVRHASLADSLVSAFVTTNLAGLRPRYVLKRELLLDPCLDVVGQRIPNYFLDRATTDSAPELAALERLTTGLGQHDIAIIFPEGTRANPRKREKSLEKIAEHDPERARKLSALRNLLPPRPSGAAAMMRGAPDVDVILAWHVGFEGLDTFGGILAALNRRPAPILFSARRVANSDVPRGHAFNEWLDRQWVRMDAEVGAAFASRHDKET